MRGITTGELLMTVAGVIIYSFVTCLLALAATKHGLWPPILVVLLLFLLGGIGLRQHLRFLRRRREQAENQGELEANE